MNTGGAASPVGAARSEVRRTSRDPEPSRRSPRDLPRPVGPTMALGAVVALAGFAAVALNRWPGLTASFEPASSRMSAKGAPPRRSCSEIAADTTSCAAAGTRRKTYDA